jgi:hypothetical protein
MADIEEPGQDEVSWLLLVEADAIGNAVWASFQFGVQPILDVLFRSSTKGSDRGGVRASTSTDRD